MTTRKKKIAVLAGAFALSMTAGALLGGLHPGQAWGVRRPHDPANYWTTDTISWADTNDPGYYFYYDLGKQGGNVYDLTREIKSILFGDNFLNILAKVAEKLGIHEINRYPLDEKTTRGTEIVVADKSRAAENAYAERKRVGLAGTPIFHQPGEDGLIAIASRNPEKQYMAIAAAAEAYAQIAQDNIAQNDETAKTVLRLLDAARNAEGKRQLQEIEEQLQTVIAANKSQLSTLLATKAQMKADQERVQYDEHVEWMRETQQGELVVFDPYSENRQRNYKESGKEKSAPRGFVEF